MDSLLIHLNPGSYPGSGTVWNDAQGNFNFNLVGGVSFSNNEMVFNGSTGYAETVTSYPSIPKNTDPISLEMYVNLGNFVFPFLTSKISPSNGNLCLAIDSTQLGFVSDGGGGNVNYSTGAYSGGNAANTYIHLTATYNGDVIKLYKNSELKHTSATGRNMGANTAPLRLMCLDPSNSPYFWPVNGKLKVFRLYAKALSEEEVIQNFDTLRSKDTEILISS